MAKNIKIALDWNELMVAAQIGIMRKIASLQNNRADNHNGPSDWNTDIEGTATELTVMKYLNIAFIPKINTFKAHDIGRFQVRCTSHANGKLIIRDRDKDESVFIFGLTHELPIVTLVGMFDAKRAKSPKFKYEPTSWWVPQSELDDLPDPEAERKYATKT